MIATAFVRSWMRRLALALGALALAGVALGLAAGNASAAIGAKGNTVNLTPAKKALLVKADLPAGWIGQGKVTTSKVDTAGTFPGEDQLAACLGVPKSALGTNTPSATSPNFQDKDGTGFVQDNVSVFSSASSAARSYRTIANTKVPSCLNTAYQDPAAKAQLEGAAGSGVTLGAISVTPAPAAILIPHSTGFTVSFDATEQGVTAHSAVTLVSMVRGKLGSQLTFTAVGNGSLSTSLERHLISVAYGRT
ncbi:MAG TPA: hypothetical protein VHD39_05635 [Acidimicrobiales bacterium]|nr:hypothetical protein [Acidimicrobiales bacterium]